MKYIYTLLLLLLPLSVFAQEQKTPEQQEKEFRESIEKEVDRLADNLDLDDWQIFYVDSILIHDYTAMQQEMMELNSAKVSNMDIYYIAQDKWMEAIYNSFHKIFTDEQWAKYLKTGAARDKKVRDKRAAKRK